jgi:hypothetical protein
MHTWLAVKALQQRIPRYKLRPKMHQFLHELICPFRAGGNGIGGQNLELNKTCQTKAAQETEQNATEQNRTEQNGTEHSRTEQNKVERNRTNETERNRIHPKTEATTVKLKQIKHMTWA